ncbi:MAG: hypothetical protein ACE5GA_00680 [Candidatus Zixiibacteriota bacterium]
MADKKKRRAPYIFGIMSVLALLFLASGAAQAQQEDLLNVTYGKGEVFDVPGESFKVKLDLDGFVDTYDGPPGSEVILTVGNPERRMILQVTYDTLLADIKPLAEEYQKLWWFFYPQDSSSQVGEKRSWTEDGRHWSTFTILSVHGFDVTEKHYDMFEINRSHYFHASIKRPLYLEGDSTLMLSILESFEVIYPEESSGKTDKSQK